MVDVIAHTLWGTAIILLEMECENRNFCKSVKDPLKSYNQFLKAGLATHFRGMNKVKWNHGNLFQQTNIGSNTFFCPDKP